MGCIGILYYIGIAWNPLGLAACIRATLVLTVTRHSGSKFTLPSHQ